MRAQNHQLAFLVIHPVAVLLLLWPGQVPVALLGTCQHALWQEGMGISHRA